MTQSNKCVIYYKKGWLNSRTCYGHQFDKLQECCVTFKDVFFNTGNEKSDDWDKNGLYNSQPSGLNFLSRGGELKLFLCGESVGFCPWCGSSVEIKQSKNVTLKERNKKVRDGFEEVEVPTEV